MRQYDRGGWSSNRPEPHPQRLGLGYARISKRTFYAHGGFANSRCVRVTRGGSWAYFYNVAA